MSRFQTDVFIVGGGPAGLSAAIAARQQGLRVLLADFSQPPIDKACGEGLMSDSLQALSALGVSLEGLDTGVFEGIRFIGPNGYTEARFPNGPGLGIRRTLLHQALIDRASLVGADLMWGSQVTVDSNGVLTVNGESVRYKWLVGADGNNSRIRRFARLETGSAFGRRIGLRRHFRVRPWSEFVEIYWGSDCQAYVTPIASDQVCVAVIARERPESFEGAITQFSSLSAELAKGEVCSTIRGAVTVSRRFPSVTTDRVALIGEASGSADAITGEGLAMCFRQAVALGRALGAEDLSTYEREHRKIMALPQFMGRAMLLMDKNHTIRTRTLSALSTKPAIFQRMLCVHVGAIPMTKFGFDTALQFGWQFLNA